MAIGIAACITIFTFVQYECSFDSFNKNAERIYRVNLEADLNGKKTHLAVTPALLGPFLSSQLSQIRRVVRVYAVDVTTSTGKPYLRYGEKVIRANHFILADSTFLDVFSFKLILGNQKTALNAPFSVVLTKDAAQRLFGDRNPIGKVIVYDNKSYFTVTGVVQNPPTNSTIQFDYLGSLNSLPDMTSEPNVLMDRDRLNYYTYALFKRNTNVKDIQKRLQNVVAGFWDNTVQSMLGSPVVYFEPLKALYWDNNLMDDIPIKGSKTNIVAFSVIAAIIFLIACANFINLTTSRSLIRAKEIGIRKVVGAQRKQLVGQFMTESGLMTFIALLTAVTLNELFIPIMDRVLRIDIQLDYFHSLTFISLILGAWIVTNLFSGILPALYLSSFQSVSSLKGITGRRAVKGVSRYLFILLQFSGATATIFCTIVVAKQYELLRFKNVGFNRNNIVVLKYDEGMTGDYESFKQRLLENPHVLGMTATEAVPGGTYGYGQFFYTNNGNEGNLQAYGEEVDPGYIPVLGLKLLAGRDFSWTNPSDKADAYILNEAAVRKIGWTTEGAVGQPFGYLQSKLP
ncbi:MAG: ABC transporter permease, partial [Nitrososphaerota archaeon]|nr:ABC transporter permease [Nitrososphaerota archaeon]